MYEDTAIKYRGLARPDLVCHGSSLLLDVTTERSKRTYFPSRVKAPFAECHPAHHLAGLYFILMPHRT